MARAVVQQLGWGATDGDEVELEVMVGTDKKVFMAAVSEDTSPSLVAGDGVRRWLVQVGWGISDELWIGELSEFDEPQERRGDVVCGELPAELGFKDGEAETMEGIEWNDLIDEHQRQAVEGEEPGGLVSGQGLAPLSNSFRDNWRALVEEGKETQIGPEYMQPKVNPVEFQGLKQEFAPGKPHECYDEWAAMVPTCDAEVMVWIRDMTLYEVQEHEEALGLMCKNGKCARDNQEALQPVLVNRLIEESYEFAEGGVKNLVPVNFWKSCQQNHRFD